MSENRGGSEPELLVAARSRTFGEAVAEAVDSAEVAASAEYAAPATDDLTGDGTEKFDGAIVDGRIAEPGAVIERLTETANLPVGALIEAGDDDAIARAIEAGATDVFPRTTASAQYKVVVEQLVGDRLPTNTGEKGSAYGEAYEALFEKISEGLVVHEPETGVIVDVNERFCEMNGYRRSELLGEPIGIVMTDDEAYGQEAAREMIQRAREKGPQQFEWRNQHRDGETVPVEVDLTVIELDGAERVLASVQDITERKRREREYEQIFNGVQDAITVFDPEAGEITEINAAYREMLGYDLERIRELGIDGLSVNEEGYTGERGWDLISEVAETGESETVEWRAETSHGDRIWVEVTLTAAEIGGERRVLSIQRDVTERKRREQEFEQIFNGVQDPIVVFDPATGEITEVNEPYHDMVGYEDLETIRELGIGGLSADAEEYTAERGVELIREVNATGEPKTVEWEVETASGERRYLDITLSPAVIRGEERVLTIQRDITERKRREQEYERIFNGVQDAIVVFDPDTLEILDANEAYLEMFGHESVSELRERGVSGLSITEEGYTERRGREIHQRVARSGQPEIVEWQGETSGGERVWLEVKVAPAVIGGELRTVSIQRDITERKRRKQRLEVFNRILRHNLRNQLDVIQSHAEELAERTADHHAARIVAAANELAGVGRRARQVDRIVSKDDSLNEIDITRTVREVVETMAAAGGDVAVTTELPTEARLRTDEETVTMAVESALENALEHAASTVTVTVDDGADECVITIADDGPGIPEEELTPIEAQTETRLQHGTGLGLWQLRWCVDTLNGELSFVTDAGTTVRMTVPDQRESDRSG